MIIRTELWKAAAWFAALWFSFGFLVAYALNGGL